jgi:hypothetical protein
MMDLLGYAASLVVLATFLMRTMVPLRLLAILSNILFLLYGYIEHIYPVMFLHITLLPVNTIRLIAAARLGRSVQLEPALRALATKCGSRPHSSWSVIGFAAGEPWLRARRRKKQGAAADVSALCRGADRAR